MQDHTGDHRSRFRVVLDFLKRLLGKRPASPPADPYACAMAPLRRGPKGRSGAAVAEIKTTRTKASLRAEAKGIAFLGVLRGLTSRP